MGAAITVASAAEPACEVRDSSGFLRARRFMCRRMCFFPLRMVMSGTLVLGVLDAVRSHRIGAADNEQL